MLAVAGYAAYNGLRPGGPAPPPPPGCQVGTGVAAITLDTDQAGIAATIAGVAARHRLPRQAITIAYAAALQESQMQTLDYGDLDSVVQSVFTNQGADPSSLLSAANSTGQSSISSGA